MLLKKFELVSDELKAAPNFPWPLIRAKLKSPLLVKTSIPTGVSEVGIEAGFILKASKICG